MDSATSGSSTSLAPATRVWLDDPNPIFRRGLAAALTDSRFVVVGESAGLVPPPALHDVDVLVFDLGEHPDLASNLRRPPLSRRPGTRLVGLVPGGDTVPVQRSQCTVLVRSELTPEAFRNCLASLAAGPPPGRSGGAGPVAAAVAGTADRLRRLVGRRGVLFAVALALAAQAFGPSGRAEGLSDSASVSPARETAPVRSPGDAAGDVAVWVDGADPSASLVIGVDRDGALESYDLSGRRVQRLDRPAGSVTGVDVRNGFPLAGRTVALVGAGGRHLAFFRVDPAARRLREVGARPVARQGAEFGFCLYRSAVSGRFYAFRTDPDGDLTQYELADRGGLVDAREVRRFPLGRPARSCVADDETGRLFVAEASGVWRYDAEPDASPVARQAVDKVGGDHLAASVGGLAVVTQPGRHGFLVASSRGDNSFAIYRRGGDHGWLGQREVVDGPDADGCSASTAIEAVATRLGPAFPAGIFVCQDARNTPPEPAGRQNFKFVRLERFLEAGRLRS